MHERQSITVDVDYGLGKGLGCFLGQIVAYAALDNPVVSIFARELLGIGAAVWVWCTIGIASRVMVSTVMIGISKDQFNADILSFIRT